MNVDELVVRDGRELDGMEIARIFEGIEPLEKIVEIGRHFDGRWRNERAHVDLILTKLTGFDRIDEAEHSAMNLENVLARDRTEPIDERTVDVLQGEIEPEHFLLLDERLARHGHARFDDVTRLAQVQRVPFDRIRMVDVQVVRVAFRSSQVRVRVRDAIEFLEKVVDEREVFLVDLFDEWQRAFLQLQGSRVGRLLD